MASKLEGEDRVRDAAFNKAMHGKSSTEKTAFMAMLQKDKAAQSAAVDEYFKFWDGKGAGKETEVDMAVGLSFPPPQPRTQLLINTPRNVSKVMPH